MPCNDAANAVDGTDHWQTKNDGMKESLVAQFDRHPAGIGPNGERMDTPFYTVNYDFRSRPTDVAMPINA
jgi:hypothetical protein